MGPTQKENRLLTACLGRSDGAGHVKAEHATSRPGAPGKPMKQAATTSGSTTMGASQWGQQPEAGLGSSRLVEPAMLNRHGSEGATHAAAVAGHLREVLTGHQALNTPTVALSA